MKLMKVLTILLTVFVTGASFAAKIPLAEARAQISACIAKPEKMGQVIKQLSPEDQVAFLAAVNEAIAGMPGSNEAKAAAFLNVNRAAVSAADSGNKTAMIAEMFATVSVEALPIVNERFAADALNINADPSRKITNEQFTRVAENIMAKVNERTASAENGAVRSAFAILMLIRAENDTIPDLAEKLIKTLPEKSQHAARTEWIPAAMGTNQTKSYEPLLGSADNVNGDMLQNNVVIRLVGPQLLESMLGEIVEGTPLINNSDFPEIHSVGPREDELSPQPRADPTKEPDAYPWQAI